MAHRPWSGLGRGAIWLGRRGPGAVVGLGALNLPLGHLYPFCVGLCRVSGGNVALHVFVCFSSFNNVCPFVLLLAWHDMM